MAVDRKFLAIAQLAALLLTVASCSPGTANSAVAVTPSDPSRNEKVSTATQGRITSPTVGERSHSSPTPEDWREAPVIPSASAAAMEIYRHGRALSNNPAAFSKVGDCESTTSWFLGDFDASDQFYSLGNYTHLQEVVDHFHGSYNRSSLAVRRGFSAATALSPLWADTTQCGKQETPLACELRLHRPSIVLIMLGSNDLHHKETFDSDLRQVIQYVIEQGAVPVLATKADNLEGDHSINATIVRLTREFDIPLWNFWAAVQGLPNHGLQEDSVHLTWGPNNFSDPSNMRNAWPVRNLTALQTLDALWRSLENLPPAAGT